MMRRWPRWVHRVYAAIAGYYWMPCGVCGQSFGGHEVYVPTVDLYSEADLRRGFRVVVNPCPACAREAEQAILKRMVSDG